MIYSVHFYFSKLNSRKPSNKIETIVFAKDKMRAEELIRDMISNYPIKVEEPFSIIGSIPEKPLHEIYNERPELRNVPPEKGYIYNEYLLRSLIKKYIG